MTRTSTRYNNTGVKIQCRSKPVMRHATTEYSSPAHYSADSLFPSFLLLVNSPRFDRYCDQSCSLSHERASAPTVF